LNMNSLSTTWVRYTIIIPRFRHFPFPYDKKSPYGIGIVLIMLPTLMITTGIIASLIVSTDLYKERKERAK